MDGGVWGKYGVRGKVLGLVGRRACGVLGSIEVVLGFRRDWVGES